MVGEKAEYWESKLGQGGKESRVRKQGKRES